MRPGEDEEGERDEIKKPFLARQSLRNRIPEDVNVKEEGSEGEDKLEDKDLVKMRVLNHDALLDSPCRTGSNAKKVKRHIASGGGDKVQESPPPDPSESVLASSVRESVHDNDFREGINAISDSIRGGPFGTEAGEMLRKDDLLSIAGRVNGAELNTVVFKFTQLFNKLQLALKINSMKQPVRKIYESYAAQAGAGAMTSYSFYQHNKMGEKLMCLVAAGGIHMISLVACSPTLCNFQL